MPKSKSPLGLVSPEKFERFLKATPFTPLLDSIKRERRAYLAQVSQIRESFGLPAVAEAVQEQSATATTVAPSDTHETGQELLESAELQRHSLSARPELEVVSLGAAVAEYLEMKSKTLGRNGKVIKPRTLQQMQLRLQTLLDVVGESTPVYKVNRRHRDKVTAYLFERGYQAKTHNHYVNEMSSFFRWAEECDYTQKNHFKNCALKNHRKPPVIFTQEQLTQLFQHSCFQSQSKPEKYWLPLLALFTGARSGELCQLAVDDLVYVDKVPCIRIDEVHTWQSVKNEESKRLIPLHPTLIELGVIEFVEKRAQQGALRWFDAFGHQQSEPSSIFAARFRKVLDAVGIVGERRPTMHAFRRLVATVLKFEGVAEQHAASLLGHIGDLGISYTVYGARCDSLERKQELILMLDFSEALKAVKPFYILPEGNDFNRS